MSLPAELRVMVQNVVNLIDVVISDSDAGNPGRGETGLGRPVR